MSVQLILLDWNIKANHNQSVGTKNTNNEEAIKNIIIEHENKP